MLSGLFLGFLFVCQTTSLSVLTDDKPKSEDTKADLTRQLLNQETVIRMNLDRKVYDLMRDMADMKTKMADMKTSAVSNNKQLQEEIKDAKKEIFVLKHENSALKAELQLQSNETTLISANLRTTSRDFANMKTNTDSNNKLLKEEITNAKKEILVLKHENVALKADLQLQSNETTLISANLRTTSRDFANMKTNTDSNNKQLKEEITNAKKEILALRHENVALKADLQLQSNETTLISANLKTTINTIKQSQKAQQQLSSAVLALEDFQKNTSSLSSSRSAQTRVGFTAGVTERSGTWQGDIFVFPHVITNIGNGYSTSTGKFTAPKAGTYVFFLTAVSYGTSYLYLDIVHDGAKKVRTYSHYSASYQTGTNLAVLGLSQGDMVWVRFTGGIGYYTESVPLTTFSGFLL